MATNSRQYNKANYSKYWWSTKAKKERAARNTARNRAIAAGKVSKGDWLEVHHKNWTPTDNNKKNLAVVTRKYNRRDWARKANSNPNRKKKYDTK